MRGVRKSACGKDRSAADRQVRDAVHAQLGIDYAARRFTRHHRATHVVQAVIAARTHCRIILQINVRRQFCQSVGTECFIRNTQERSNRLQLELRDIPMQLCPSQAERSAILYKFS